MWQVYLRPHHLHHPSGTGIHCVNHQKAEMILYKNIFESIHSSDTFAQYQSNRIWQYKLKFKSNTKLFILKSFYFAKFQKIMGNQCETLCCEGTDLKLGTLSSRNFDKLTHVNSSWKTEQTCLKLITRRPYPTHS